MSRTTPRAENIRLIHYSRTIGFPLPRSAGLGSLEWTVESSGGWCCSSEESRVLKPGPWRVGCQTKTVWPVSTDRKAALATFSVSLALSGVATYGAFPARMDLAKYCISAA